MRHALLLATSMVALASAARAEAPFDFDRAPGKLPKTVVPDAYRIEITPDLQKLTLTGQETIDLEVRSAVPSFTLNQAGLTLASAKLEDGTAAAIKLDETRQEATLTFAKPVAAGKHTLAIAYSGPIPQTPSGIYYDDYRDAAGAKKRMLVTQFEVADARRMFPGWDEPAFKATFQLSVTLPAGLAVVSNMPAAETKPAGPGLQRVTFATTPRMSTYLLALLAGDMQAVRSHAGSTDLAAWAPAGEAEQGRYALQAETAILPYYDDYFGVNFPLPKLDLIAVPGNYEAGAMENWGAITFIDNAMLFDPKTSSPATRELIYLVVAHEMAHQWSGDLVTMGWWDNIWLNEGFATWMENKATDHFNPSWQTWPRQHADHEQAMAQDAAPTTHPIQQVIRDESEANSAFDVISYQKGSQIIRMVEDWIGPDTFRDGMRRYMKAHAYGNATSADLWAALGAVSHQDVAGMASTFTEQPGIPLVHVARACADGHAQVTLTQDRFTIHDPHPKPLTWRIPVSLGEPGGGVQHVLLGEAPATLQAGSCYGVLKANWGENGYYRTQYDAASLQALAKGLLKLDAADRANLLGDQFALFVADRAPLSGYLDLLADLHDETSIAVWTDTLGHLARIDQALVGTALRPRFAAFAAGLIRPEFARLGWDAKPGEPFLDSLLRPRLVESLGAFQDQAVLAEARRRFDAFRHDAPSLPPALREPVLDIVGHTADQATYDSLRTMAVAASSTEEKLRYVFAMAAASDPKLVAQTIDFAASSGQVPNGRIIAVLEGASQDSEQAEQVYRLTKPVAAKIATVIPADGLGPSPLAAAASGSSDPTTATALLADPSSQSSAGAHIWAARMAERIRASAELRQRVVPQVQAWLGRRASQ